MDLSLEQPRFLPTTREEMRALGWEELDVLLVTGDAYVDHPSFGAALLGRWLVAHGFRTGIVAQPRWTSTEDVARLGRPRLYAGVTAGALDSMVAHYTAFRKKRHDDAYTPGGEAGKRPNRACIVYASLVKQAYPKLPIVLGGIEASLRRVSHYDFWTEKVRRSVLLDAKADLILYGMAERSVVEVARRIDKKEPIATPSLPGAVYLAPPLPPPLPTPLPPPSVPGPSPLSLPSHEAILADPRLLMEATLTVERQVHQAKDLAVQPVEGRQLVMTPPRPLEAAELDRLYALPFTREAHPSYTKPVPAAEMIRFSITSHRGCAGGCSFCTLAAHQGRTLTSRSEGSVVAEAEGMVRHARFGGSITDVGGPSANMWGGRCADDPATCKRASCLAPGVCPHFKVDQGQIVGLLRKVSRVRGVKHVRVASGIRHDLAVRDPGYVRALVREFVGGQLKIAPEHLSDAVLRLMRKPGKKVFEQFLEMFARECEAAGKEQFVIPYLISAFPGCTPGHMRELTEWLRERGWRPQQVQCFIPLPGTVAAAMYAAGVDPSGKEIPVPRTDAERMRMHYELVGGGEGKDEGGRMKDERGGRRGAVEGQRRKWGGGSARGAGR